VSKKKKTVCRVEGRWEIPSYDGGKKRRGRLALDLGKAKGKGKGG